MWLEKGEAIDIWRDRVEDERVKESDMEVAEINEKLERAARQDAGASVERKPRRLPNGECYVDLTVRVQSRGMGAEWLMGGLAILPLKSSAEVRIGKVLQSVMRLPSGSLLVRIKEVR